MDPLAQHDAQLPKLPVPLLEATIHQALAAIKPLIAADDYAAVLEEASLALADPTIRLMQQHLEAAAASASVLCYLNAVNGESAPGIYGALRGDTLPRNPYLVLQEDPFAQTVCPPNQAQRAAALVNLALRFVVALRRGMADTTPRHGTPLLVACYRNLFGTTRVPLAEGVTIQHAESRHVLFICNNRYFALEALAPPGALWFSDAELAHEIQALIDRADAERGPVGVGALTTQTYSQWRALRRELQRLSPDFLRQVDSALFVVALDSSAPASDHDKTRVVAHGSLELRGNVQAGSCTLRWYDKLQLVVTRNAVAGVVWELSTMDLTAVLRFVSDIYTDLVLKLARNINGTASTLFAGVPVAAGARPRATLLVPAPTPELCAMVRWAETRLLDLLRQHEHKTLALELDVPLLAKCGVLPDLFVQVAFQCAHYALYGRVPHTWEPITTRRFRDARTDLVAVQSDALAALVKMFISLGDGARKWAAFRAQCDAHAARCRDAMAGRGFERHLGALHTLALSARAVARINAANPLLPPLEVPRTDAPALAFLSAPAVLALASPELLISNCGNAAMHLFGVPPATDLGFGVGYILHRDKVVVTVASKFRQTERLLLTLDAVVRSVKRMLCAHADVPLALADTAARRAELARLRIERELRLVDRTLPATRHPIPLDVGPAPDGLAAGAGRARADSDDYAYLGGYGYFDGDEVELRSGALSRSESFVLSRPGSFVQSRSESFVQSPGSFVQSPGSVVQSRPHLCLNLAARDNRPGDRLHERIAEKFSMRLGLPEPRPKHRIGHALG